MRLPGLVEAALSSRGAGRDLQKSVVVMHHSPAIELSQLPPSFYVSAGSFCGLKDILHLPIAFWMHEMRQCLCEIK
jgi:hypothetical protein